jgi:hypothetical protein
VPEPGTDPLNPPSQNPPAPNEEALAAARATLEAAGLVAVPQDGWATVQANAAAGARVAQTNEKERRNSIIAQAVRDGRIAPAQRQHFVLSFEKDPQGTEQLLTASVDKGGLMPNTIPVEARGGDPGTSATADAYPSEWLPELSGETAPNITVEA